MEGIRRRPRDKSKTKQPLPLVETELRTTTVSTTDLKDRYRPMGHEKMKTASDSLTERVAGTILNNNAYLAQYFENVCRDVYGLAE